MGSGILRRLNNQYAFVFSSIGEEPFFVAFDDMVITSERSVT